MAVVRTVIHIVRTVNAREPLQKKRGFVAAASGGIEETAARLGVPQSIRNTIESFIPAEPPIVAVTHAANDWISEAPEVFQFARGHPGELFKGESIEEIPGDRGLHVGCCG